MGIGGGNGFGVIGSASTGVGVYGINSSGGTNPFGVVGTVQTAPGFALYGIATVRGHGRLRRRYHGRGGIAGQFTGPVNIYNGGAGIGATSTCRAPPP